MRILSQDNSPAPEFSNDPERLETLEKIASTILQRIQALEKRIDALEAAPSAPPIVITPVVEPAPLPQVAIDADALKKGLLTPMWKHLNAR